MPLTLEQYANYLDTRGTPWPAPPVVEPAKAKPHLAELHGIKAVLWNVYGTLLAIPMGELLFEHPQPLIMDVALDKTINEFNMWGSMSRKPGRPAEYMKHLYSQELLQHQSFAGPERHPEVQVEKIWEALLKKLFQKDYQFDAGFFGSLNEYSKKVAYFFHASLQATAGQPEAATALKLVADLGLRQGLLADGQCFTPVQLSRAFKVQDRSVSMDELLPPPLRVLSCEVKVRKPSETLFRHAVAALLAAGIRPEQTLHVGNKLARDIAPARRTGMKTALYAGDKASLDATPEMLKDPAYRPDVLLTELGQIAQVIG
jgi:FMN phosphatase YigB (HAD superfamily)